MGIMDSDFMEEVLSRQKKFKRLKIERHFQEAIVKFHNDSISYEQLKEAGFEYSVEMEKLEKSIESEKNDYGVSKVR